MAPDRWGSGSACFVVIIAALNLVLDFDFIESGARAGAPKYMEWYGAFGLMVTLVWLYLEILRLLIESAEQKLEKASRRGLNSSRTCCNGRWGSRIYFPISRIASPFTGTSSRIRPFSKCVVSGGASADARFNSTTCSWVG